MSLKIRNCVPLVLLIQLTCVNAAPAASGLCSKLPITKNVSMKLIHKGVETVQGLTAQMGTFEIRNIGRAPIVLSGYTEKNGFSMWHPDAWLQRKLPDGSWEDLSDSYSDTLPSPNTLTVEKNASKEVITTIHTGDPTASPTTELRLVIHTLKPALCIASAPFILQ